MSALGTVLSEETKPYSVEEWQGMIVVVYGGNASGKSALAEKIAESLLDHGIKATEDPENSRGRSLVLYLATMRRDGSSLGRERIEKHHKRRRNRRFTTLEYTTDLRGLAFKKPEDVILLEDAGNLVANAMFPEEEKKEKPAVVFDGTENEGMLSGLQEQVKHIMAETRHLVIVTNNIFDGGIILDEQLREYTEVLGELNQYLAGLADIFVESVCGLPHVLKGKDKLHVINGVLK